MAVKLNDLNEIAAGAPSDIMYIEDASEAAAAAKAKKINLQKLAEYFRPRHHIVAFEPIHENNADTVISHIDQDASVLDRAGSENIALAGNTITLSHGRKYICKHVPKSDISVNLRVSIRSNPFNGTARSIDEWEQTSTQYFNTNREALLVSIIDLTDAAVDEQVVLFYQGAGVENLSVTQTWMIIEEYP